ncbi:hypothetical protein F4810DRAFT_173746 [Camillea tinctor]|nr:hypothetical protein F4810DRAFT_173746 [Camillea tinctor]
MMMSLRCHTSHRKSQLESPALTRIALLCGNMRLFILKHFRARSWHAMFDGWRFTHTRKFTRPVLVNSISRPNYFVGFGCGCGCGCSAWSRAWRRERWRVPDQPYFSIGPPSHMQGSGTTVQRYNGTGKRQDRHRLGSSVLNQTRGIWPPTWDGIQSSGPAKLVFFLRIGKGLAIPASSHVLTSISYQIAWGCKFRGRRS